MRIKKNNFLKINKTNKTKNNKQFSSHHSHLFKQTFMLFNSCRFFCKFTGFPKKTILIVIFGTFNQLGICILHKFVSFEK